MSTLENAFASFWLAVVVAAGAGLIALAVDTFGWRGVLAVAGFCGVWLGLFLHLQDNA